MIWGAGSGNGLRLNGLGMGNLTSDVLQLYGGDYPQCLAAVGCKGRVREPTGMPIKEASQTALGWVAGRERRGDALRPDRDSVAR